MAHSKFGEFGNTEELQFLHDCLTLVFNGFAADAKKVRYFLGAFPIGDQLQNFTLPVSKVLIDRRYVFRYAL